MSAHPVTSSQPQPAKFKRLLMAKFGQLTCRHIYRLQVFRGRMFLRCDHCPAETEGFEVYRPLRGGR